jgi:hypothetical protein
MNSDNQIKQLQHILISDNKLLDYRKLIEDKRNNRYIIESNIRHQEFNMKSRLIKLILDDNIIHQYNENEHTKDEINKIREMVNKDRMQRDEIEKNLRQQEDEELAKYIECNLKKC